MEKTLKILKTAARIAAMVVAVPGIFFFLGIIAMANRPLPPSDKLFIIAGIVYFTSLFLGMKWLRIGALICFPVGVAAFIMQIYNSIAAPEFNEWYSVFTVPLLLLITGVLYLLAWYYQRKLPNPKS